MCQPQECKIRGRPNLYPLGGDRWVNHKYTEDYTQRERKNDSEEESCMGTEEGGSVISTWAGQVKLYEEEGSL